MGVCLFLALVACLAPIGARDRSPVHSGIAEQTSRYLSVVRLRIEPTRNATIGQCQELGVEDLVVSVQGKSVTGRDVLDLDRKRPPTMHALVIDNSASMVDDLDYAVFAAKEYVKQLRPDREKALIMTFDENVVMVQAPTGNRERLLSAIDRIRAGSRTSMLDALYYSMQELDAHRERPVLILLSDGADTSSMYGVEDIARQVVDRTDLTVFTIGVGLKTDQGVKPTRKLMRDLAEATNGKYFEVTEGQSLRKVFGKIRDILENEAILTVVDPTARERRSNVRVDSRDPDCRVRILGYLGDESAPTGSREPIPRPYPSPPEAFEAPLRTAHYNALTRAGQTSVDPGCSAGRYFSETFGRGQFVPKWFVHVGQRNASGCGPDVTLEHGRLYEPAAEKLCAHNESLRLTARPFEIPIPPLDELPASAAEAVDYLARRALELADTEFPTESWVRDGEGHARPFQDYPTLVHGMTFLGMRGVLARAQFLYEDYRSWVFERLEVQASRELAFLERRYRGLFPDQPDEAIALAARESVDGHRILARAREPSEVDLQPYLSAWLGDISAHDLFRAWEMRRIDRAIQGVDDDELDRRFVEAWVEMRRVFYAPSYARVLTVLVPVHDEECDCVGFWRVVLPRPAWFAARVSGLTAGHEFTGDQLDLVPDLPAAWITFQRMVDETPGLLTFLRESGYRADTLRYALLGEPSGHDPENAFAYFGAELLLAEEGARNESAEPEVIVLRSKLKRERSDDELPTLAFDDLNVEATQTAMSLELAEQLRQAGMRIFGQVEQADADTAGEPASETISDPIGAGVWASVEPVLVTSSEPTQPSPAASGDGPPPGPSSSPTAMQRESVVAVQVPVQVVRDGEPVRGLTADNFQLIDQGKPREITAVEFVDLPSATTVSNEARRQLVFLFDLSFSGPGPVERAREAVVESLDRLHPSDMVALVAYSADQGPKLALDFTADRDRLHAALDLLGQGIAQRSGTDNFGELGRGEETSRGPGDLQGGPTGGGAKGGAADEHLEGMMSGFASGQRRNERVRLHSMCQDFTNVARALSKVDGKKQVVLFSEGFDQSLVVGSSDSQDQLRFGENQERGQTWDIEGRERSGDAALQSAIDAMLEEFRRADATIQAVEISPSGPSERSGTRRGGADGLNMLARGTGGELYRSSNDLPGTFQSVLDQTGVYYVLFFQPGDLDPDGSYHKLKVRLKNAPRGSKATYRQGYFAPSRR